MSMFGVLGAFVDSNACNLSACIVSAPVLGQCRLLNSALSSTVSMQAVAMASLQACTSSQVLSHTSTSSHRPVARHVTRCQQSVRSAATAHHFVGSRNMADIGRPRSRQVACQGLFGLGLPELVVIAGVTALIFGPSKLPEIGKGLGKTVKSFQTAAKEFETELKQATSDDADVVKTEIDKAAEAAKKAE
eukprot:jgi/Chrzof1/9352/UNPLg00323.t1_TATA[v5.2]